MKKITELYSSPNTTVLVVRFEENLLIVSGGANWASQAGGAGGNDSYSDGEDF